MATTAQALSEAYPLGSRLNERGRLEIGGCDTIELAREFGTPAYVVAEEDLRARAQRFSQAAASSHANMRVLFATKAFPCRAVLELFAGAGLSCEVASGGELHIALAAGFAPELMALHGNAKTEDELRMALRAAIGLIVIDNADEVDCLERLVAEGLRPDEQRVLVRVVPEVDGDTHHKISTGQADTKFGVSLAQAPALIERLESIEGLRLAGLHAHVGSQLMDLDVFEAAARALSGLGAFPVYDLGGGLGVTYTDERPPSVEEYVGAVAAAGAEHLGPDVELLIEPGRSLVANGCATLYTVQSVKRNVSTWVAVDGGMSDNLRPMLYGARYEAQVADRFGGSVPCRLTGKHCESGDVIVSEALLDDPRVGDVIVTPVTGAYGWSMANNYNGALRPPVIFCKDGDARVVAARQTLADLPA